MFVCVCARAGELLPALVFLPSSWIPVEADHQCHVFWGPKTSDLRTSPNLRNTDCFHANPTSSWSPKLYKLPTPCGV